MRLTDYLDKGAMLGEDRPCLTMLDQTLTYLQTQKLSYKIARVLQLLRVKPGSKVAILSSNDPIAFSCVFGISRAGAVWCPINPRSEANENSFVLNAFDCECLIFQSSFEALVEKMLPDLPNMKTLICLDKKLSIATSLAEYMDTVSDEPIFIKPIDDLAMIAGTGGTTGQPKGVMLTGRNIETMSALTLVGFPYEGRPAYLAMTPLTHAAGVLCFPIMLLGGRIVMTSKPDLGEYLQLIEQFKITHSFLPPTLIYMLLQSPYLSKTDTSSLQCLWYGAAPISPARLEEAIVRLGPIMGQFFGQTEAPMMISMMSPKDHFNEDGSIARHRLSSAGRPSPLVQVAAMSNDGKLLDIGERGEIVVRGSLVMPGYYKNEKATAESSIFGWHHTGDIGYIDDEGYLYIVDRAKDMIITGGFNVYSVEVEQALMQHPGVLDCAVIGMPDEKWGERVVAVLQLNPDCKDHPDSFKQFVKDLIGSVKAPKQIEVWPDLPKSKVGKVLKKEIRATLMAD
jgi:acyl-CoA synthetase (AMP-forming)/AMP-acid ligase II